MPNPANKPIIAVDIDDVLAASAADFIKFSNKKWGTNLTIDDYDEHWAKMWQVDHKEEVRRSKVVHDEEVFLKFSHFPEARRVLEKLSKRYRLVIVTSRIRALKKGTLEWIEGSFGNLISEFHFAGIWDDIEKNSAEKVKATKAEVVRQIGADYLIDDQPKHCFAAAGAGITSLLFGDYKWNRNIELPQGVVRAKNWKEIQEYFDGRV